MVAGLMVCTCATNKMEWRANHHHHNLQSVTVLILVVLLLKQWPSSFCSASLQLEAIGDGEKENSSSGQVDVHMEKWILWNLRKYYRMKKRNYFLPQLRDEDAVVGIDPKLRVAEMNKFGINVSQDGNGDFNTIQQALDSIPPYNTRRVLIYIKPGFYREKIHIPRSLPFVTFIGNSSDPPKITGNDTASVPGRDGRPLNTFQSATVSVDADYFVAINVVFENTATHVVGSVGGQGVALRISGTKAAFFNCSFYGNQDTLYDHKGLHYFKNCFIQGSVDFIFGYGRSLYESCHLNSVAQKVASLTAQKRSNSSLASGFSFTNCTVTGSGSVYLGRAWGDYARVIFSYSFLDSLVLPQGWSDWGKTIRDSRVYYGEYKCSGPGANTTRRVPWARVLTQEEALPFLGTYYVDDAHSWLLDPPLL